MPPRTRPARSDRAPLSRDRIVRTAVGLADEVGFRALSMRRLGEALDVEAMSLYNHVANKDDLLDGMIDEVFAEIGAPQDRGGWRAAMERRGHAMREVLTRHRWAVGLMDSRTSPGPANLRHHDAVLGCLRRAGFSVRLAGHAYAALDAYVYGFVLQELALPFQGADRSTDVVGPMVEEMAADLYPHLVELATDVVLRPGYDFAEEFPYGLALVLDGLERALAQESATPSP